MKYGAYIQRQGLPCLPNQIFNSNNNFIVYENGSIFANNGVFNGQINATSGSFTGEIVATSGRFTGEINALSGNIGGFTIEDEYLSVFY